MASDLYVPQQTIDRIHQMITANTENGLLKFIDDLESFWLQLSGSVKNFGQRHQLDFEPITLNEFYYPLIIYICHLMGIALIFILEIIWFRAQSRRQRFYIRMKDFGILIWRSFAAFKHKISGFSFNEFYARYKRLLTLQNLRNLFHK